MNKHTGLPAHVDASHERTTTWHSSLYVVAAIAVLSGILIFWESPVAFFTAAIDGTMALGIIAVASAAGLWLVWGTGNGDLPVRWQIGLGAGFGLGGLSLGMLMAGLRGHLSQRFWIVVMVLLAVAGIAAIYRLGRILERQSRIVADEDPYDNESTAGGHPRHGPLRRTVAPEPRSYSCPEAKEDERSRAARWRWLWLLIVPAIVLGVLAATVPPGLLWNEEGNGYDALEYHLGVPKEYYFLGRIEYLDHNIYSNFPMNAEMLYLLPMVLYGSPFKAAITAQMIHLALGALAGYAAWLIGRDYSRKAGILAGIAGAAFPWTIWLGGLAYVENGMLFYGLLAAGLCNRAIREPTERNCFRALAIGAMVGLACGYKYTAIPMIAVPLLVLWAALNLANRPAKASNALIAVLITATLFAPWMAKNQRMTGDPLFPLGHRVFESRVWTPADYAKFERGHSPIAAEKPVNVRLSKLGERVLAEPRFGYIPWIVALLAAALALSRRFAYRREAGIWLAVLGVQALVWVFATHLFARFASVMWMPLVVLMSIVVAWALEDQRQAASFPNKEFHGHKQRDHATHPGDHGTRPSRSLSSLAPRPSLLAPLVCLAGLAVYLSVGYGWLFGEYRNHLYVQGQQLPLYGNTEALFYGNVPGFDWLQFVNGDGRKNPGLPYSAKLLMVGDARIFYVGRPCDYCVVFSRNPFAQAVEQADGSAPAVLDWLRQKGYTHVWVNFAEIDRLSRTYGFPASIRPELFADLQKAGLRPVYAARIMRSGREQTYGMIYEVPKV